MASAEITAYKRTSRELAYYAITKDAGQTRPRAQGASMIKTPLTPGLYVIRNVSNQPKKN